jgi:hypothetical protein
VSVSRRHAVEYCERFVNELETIEPRMDVAIYADGREKQATLTWGDARCCTKPQIKSGGDAASHAKFVATALSGILDETMVLICTFGGDDRMSCVGEIRVLSTNRLVSRRGFQHPGDGWYRQVRVSWKGTYDAFLGDGREQAR